ncbi:MAG: hypothetical protein Ct9H300mP16_15900 [Pseudomonadota bacterium]|nr:MAG: hypothetical protein Ct9H300mP16_15900 [Pseudomonadota bacterium]
MGLLPEEYPIGTLNEDFAFESLPGDIFQLGNTSYRIARVETGKVYVEDAKGQPPSIPFWFGEAPGRSDELSFAVSRLREQLNGHLGVDASGFKQPAPGCRPYWPVAGGRRPTCRLRRLSKAALGSLPTQSNIILTVLRRSRRHPSGFSFPIRFTRESRLGTRDQKKVLPQIQF